MIRDSPGGTTVPTRETVAFVLDELGTGSKRILEIGAGEGEVCHRLSVSGHATTALDSSAEAVRRARALGVDARVVEWPEYDGDGRRFDAVLFSRSLHHVRLLRPSVERAAALLHPDGKLLVEDFAFHEVSSGTVCWFRDRLLDVASARHAPFPRESFARRILGASDPVAAWHERSHTIHSSSALRQAIGERFQLARETGVPYLYRYLEDLVQHEELEALFELERRSIDDGTIVPLGRRFVGIPGTA